MCAFNVITWERTEEGIICAVAGIISVWEPPEGFGAGNSTLAFYKTNKASEQPRPLSSHTGCNYPGHYERNVK